MAVFEYLNIYHDFGCGETWTSKDMLREFLLVSLLSVGVSLRFFTEDRSLQYLQDATLFSLLSDKSAVYFNSENSI